MFLITIRNIVYKCMLGFGDLGRLGSSRVQGGLNATFFCKPKLAGGGLGFRL